MSGGGATTSPDRRGGAGRPSRDGSAPDRHDSVDAAIEAAMKAGDGDRVSVGDIVDVLAARSVGPLLFIPALIAVLPGVGALPGVSWGTSAIIVLLSLQIVFLKNRLWVPERIRRLRIGRGLLEKSLGWSRRPARWIDRVTRPRLRGLVCGPAVKLVGLAILAMGIAMFAASIVPGGIVAPAAVVLVLAVALTTEDGLVALFGYALAAGAVLLAFRLL